MFHFLAGIYRIGITVPKTSYVKIVCVDVVRVILVRWRQNYSGMIIWKAVWTYWINYLFLLIYFSLAMSFCAFFLITSVIGWWMTAPRKLKPRYNLTIMLQLADDRCTTELLISRQFTLTECLIYHDHSCLSVWRPSGFGCAHFRTFWTGHVFSTGIKLSIWWLKSNFSR